MKLPSLPIQMACMGWCDLLLKATDTGRSPQLWSVDGIDGGTSGRRLSVMESVLLDPCLSVHLKIGLNDLRSVWQSGCYRIISKRGADVSPPFPLRPI